MCEKDRIVSDVLSMISNKTGVTLNDVLSKKKNEEAVYARHIVIVLLYKLGICPQYISNIFNTTTRAIYYAITNFDNKISRNPYQRMLYNKIKGEILI